MRNKNFAAFILTHGRPEKVITYNTLLRLGYTGEIYIIIDNEDKFIDEYKRRFKEKVIVFNKLEVSNRIDTADNFSDRRSIVFARNACFEIARKLKIKYFVQLDDDYRTFAYSIDEYFNYDSRTRKIKNLDKIFDLMLDFFKKTNIKSIAMAQGGDFIGGGANDMYRRFRRKCMNSFICSTAREFTFSGRINEDVNTYTKLASMGDVFLTVGSVRLQQVQTQKGKGGMTDIYLDNGTYVKSFYTIIFSPSCTKIKSMGVINKRLHHLIKWNNAVPVIISEKHKKR